MDATFDRRALQDALAAAAAAVSADGDDPAALARLARVVAFAMFHSELTCTSPKMVTSDHVGEP